MGPWIYAAIADARCQADAVIVSFHGAAEMCPWPSPRRQALLRSFVDAGADIIHGHHAHVPQGYEIYRGALIAYGLGNFAVDPRAWISTRNALWSVQFEVEVGARPARFALRTALLEEQGDGSVRVRGAAPAERQEHLAYLEKCNRPLGQEALLRGVWQEFVMREYAGQYAPWLGRRERAERARLHLDASGRIRAAARGLRDMWRGYSERRRDASDDHLLWYNLFACESHADAIAEALGVLGGEREDLRTPETARLAGEMIGQAIA